MGLIDYIISIFKEPEPTPAAVENVDEIVIDQVDQREDYYATMPTIEKLSLYRLNSLTADNFDKHVILIGKIDRISTRRTKNNLLMTTATLNITPYDPLPLIWFQQPYINTQIKIDTYYRVEGTFKYNDYGFSIQNAKFESYDEWLKKQENQSEEVADTKKVYWDKDFGGQQLEKGSDWDKKRQLVLKRDGYKCVWCGSTKNLQVDHKTPLRLGGTNALYNLQTLCVDCHQLKHDRIFDSDYDADNDYGKNYKRSNKVNLINKAMRNGQLLHINYTNRNNQHTQRDIKPKRLIENRSRIYLEAFCKLRNAERYFRVSRIDKIRIV